MMYTPKPNEIQTKIESLLEKLEINSQFDKARLIRDLIIRLNTIFENKRINKDILYNSIYIILQLAQSPLQTMIDIDMLRERFEERYMRVEANKIIRNKKFDFDDLNFKRTVEFEPVDYNEESEEFSDESEIILDEFEAKEKISQMNVNIDKDFTNKEKQISRKKEISTKFLDYDNFLLKTNKGIFNTNLKNEKMMKNIFEKDNKALLDHLMKINSRFDEDSLMSLTKIYYDLFNNKSEYNNCVSLTNFTKLSNSDNEIEKYFNPSNIIGNKNQDKIKIDKNLVSSDFVLSIILVNLTYFDLSSIEDKFYFLKKFKNYICLDLEDELFQKILSEFNFIWNSLNFLRQFDLILERHEIKSTIVERFSYLIKDFLKTHDSILNSFNLLLNYQNGKLFTTNENEFYITTTSKDLIFIKEILEIHNSFVKEILHQKIKFTLAKFFFYYLNQISLILDYFINITKNTIMIKTNLNKINKYSNSLFLKNFFDMIYNYTKSKMNLINRNTFILNFEVFFNLITIYLHIIYEFAINGNLIDTYNEFFIDHLITKKENSKIIYNFNEKFRNFNWIESFKIKSFSFNKIEGASVPQIFMIDNIHFKILETCKSTFLIKNLKSTGKSKHENEMDSLTILDGENFNIWKINQTITENLKEQIELFKKNEYSDKNNFGENPLDEIKINQIDLNRINQNLEVNKNLDEQMLTEIPFKAYSSSLEKNIKLKLVDDYQSYNYIDDIFYENEEDVKNLNEAKHVYINPLQNRIYKSYYVTHNGKIEEMKEIDLLQQIIQSEEERLKMKNLKREKLNSFNKIKKSCNEISTNHYLSFDLDYILKNLVISRLISINKIVNKKLLSYLFEVEKLSDHFNLIFNLFLFKAGFSMNKFVHELNNYLNSGSHFDNFFLLNLLNEITQNSDLRSSREKILDNVSINFKDTNSVYINFQENYVVIDYQPKLPISIFFDNGINEAYNIIFNYLLRIKRASCMIKNAELDKKLKKIDKIISKNTTSYDSVYFSNESDSDGNYMKNFARKILIFLINFRISILQFLTNFEFYIFYSIIDPKIQIFTNKIKRLNSIDSLINSHVKLVREILISLGIKEEYFTKIIWKTLNIINNYIIIVNKFELTIYKQLESLEFYQTALESLESIYTDLINIIEKFKRKEKKFEFFLSQLKKKLNLN